MSAPHLRSLGLVSALLALGLAAPDASAQHRRRHRHRHHHRSAAPQEPAAAPQEPAAAPQEPAAAPQPPLDPAATERAPPRTLPDPIPPPAAQAPTAAPRPANASPRVASGESTPWSTPWRTRPLTLPARVLRIDGAIGLDRSPVVVSGSTRITSTTLAPWLRLGAGYGLSAAVEVGLSVAPLRIEGGARFQDVFAYGRFRMLHRDGFDLGAMVSVGYRYEDTLLASVAALLRWRFESIRLDVSPAVELFAGATTVADLRVPVDLWWQLASDFAIGLRTGIIAPGFTDARLGIIAGARAVYSIPRGERPFVDLFVSFDAEPLIHFSGTLFRDDFVVAQLGAQLHLGP